MTAIVGRAAELDVLRAFVGSIEGGASALVLDGEAGVGQTTLWNAGVAEAEARGFRVLATRPVESETALSFSGLGDVLDTVLEEALAPLPQAQRRALGRALLLDDDEGPPTQTRRPTACLSTNGAGERSRRPHSNRGPLHYE
jgi:hypothetical protein